MGDRFEVGARAEPEDRGAARADERQAPLGGDARLRERLRERDAVRVNRSCSSARPQMTRAFGGAQRSRKSHLRRSASSSVTSRSGKRAASGIPGEPPPEPTSTIGPSNERTTSTARSASSSEHRARLRLVAQRGQPGRRENGKQPVTQEGRRRSDSAPSPPRKSRRRRTPSAAVHDLPLDGRHRLELDALAARRHLLARFAPRATRASHAGARDSPQRRRSPLCARRRTPVRDRVQQVLHRVDRLPVPADQECDVGAGARQRDRRRRPRARRYGRPRQARSTTRASSNRASAAASLSSSATASTASSGKCATTRAGA